MVYYGKVLNGQIVLKGSERLPEGAELRIEKVEESEMVDGVRRGSPEAILPFAGIWADQAEDMDRSLAELRAMKDEELRRQALEPDPEL